MASFHLEIARNNHELIELAEQSIVGLLNEKPQGQKSKTWHQHEISNMLDLITKYSKELDDIYNDKNGLIAEDIQNMKGSNIFSSFYETLKTTREYHSRFPNLSMSDGKLPSVEIKVNFSGEEIYGKYFDLHSFYLRYCNLPQIGSRDQDYLQYLDKFNRFFYITDSCKSTKAYQVYVKDLWDYLSDFFSRVQPLIDLSDSIEEWRKLFEEKWSTGKIQGTKSSGSAGGSSQPQPLRLGMFNCVEELEALGSDRLKSALEAIGLKCGGTLQERAARLWSVRGKKAEDIPAKLKAKPSNNPQVPMGEVEEGNGGNSDGKRKRGGVDYENSRMEDTPCDDVLLVMLLQLAWTEFRIEAITSALSDVVSATRRHAEKQQSRTVEEKQAEIYEEEAGALPEVEEEEEDDGEEGPLYNPLNLPLGWDGKPIPFWLYKLHGLGVEFKCEICGNQSYWGRRAFDRHFQEWRHAHGMRCLGVPNTKHFHDITLIEDVLALFSKIKDSLKTELFLADMEEEYEDSEGNVLNRRTYEDLARQGLL